MITVVLIIILIIVIMHGGNNGASNKSKVPMTAKTLDSYSSTDATVRMTIDGPVNANQVHHEAQITIGKDDVVYQQIQSYDDTVVKTQSTANSQTAYDVFLHAINYAGFTKGNSDNKLADDRGYCPLGKRYIFELMQGGKDIERYWTTNCGGTRTYDGNADLTIQLFEAQVAHYEDVSSDFELD